MRKRLLVGVVMLVLLATTYAYAFVHGGWNYCNVYHDGSSNDAQCYFDNSDQTIQVSWMGSRFWIGRVLYSSEYVGGKRVWFYTGCDRVGRVFVVTPYD